MTTDADSRAERAHLPRWIGRAGRSVLAAAAILGVIAVAAGAAEAKPSSQSSQKPRDEKPLRNFGPSAHETTTTTSTTQTTTGTVDHADPAAGCEPTYLSRDLRDYLQLPGDQLVVVPNGEYTAGSVVAGHPATSGVYGGWLVLVAETPGGVVVDLSAAELVLQAGTSRILFVGFRFENGRVRNHGSHIRYWYTTHTFPYDTWVAAGAVDGVHNRPKTMLVADADHIELYGATFTNVGDDGINLYKSSDIRIEGSTFTNINNAGHGDIIHADALQVQGRLSRMTVRQSVIERQFISTETNGDLVDLVWEDSWFRDSRSAGITFAAKLADGTPLTVTGSRTGIRSFGHNNGRDRIDIIDGSVKTTPNTNPARIDVVDTNIVTEPPAPGTPSPAEVWRAAHPYTAWSELFA
jgi:hypothetical protein